MNQRPSPLDAVAGYLSRATRREQGHFTLLPAGARQVLVFRRLSFLPADETTMTRLRLLDEVDPKPRTSVLNGFLVGRVAVGADGRVRRGLDRHRLALLKYLLAEKAGACTVEKESRGVYRLLWPNDFVEVLIGRAAAATKCKPSVTVRCHEWHVRVGDARFHVGRFREFCRVRAPWPLLHRLLRLGRAEREDFERLSRPCILWAFGRAVDVSGSMTCWSERQDQISDRVFEKLFTAYADLAGAFLRGKRRRPEREWPLPVITTLPRPAPDEAAHRREGTSGPADPPGRLTFPRSAQSRRYRELTARQYQYLKDCVQSPVRLRFRGRSYEGVISAVDAAIYPPVWSPDHFFNCLAMTDLDPALARRMLLGGLAHFMERGGRSVGRVPVKKGSPGMKEAHPLWVLVCRRLYAMTGDVELLRAVVPLLAANDAYLDRAYRRDGVLVGAVTYWNDYSTGPKALPHVAGIGMNAFAALQKQALADFHRELGHDDQPYQRQWESARDLINELFWDEQVGFYFDYDFDRRRLYVTRRGTRFWGLDNTLPLLAEVPTPDRAARMAAPLRRSDGYGRYPAVTTDLSDDFMDERRLMVWIMTNWLVIQGLRRYGLDDVADSIATHIFNALIRGWTRYLGMPEALSASHGLSPMENPNLAGVGCWAGFYLYLQEISHLCGDARGPHRERALRYGGVVRL